MNVDTALEASPSGEHRAPTNVYRLILATSIGNALEWFDLTVYGYFAVTVSRLFFPVQDRTVSLLLTLGTFALSYLARPVGALLLGAYADRKGRKASLLLSISMMTLGTGLMALMPTYASIGLLAPLGIFVSRLLQGFSAGGEFGSSTAFLIEHAPMRRGFMSSWQFSSQGISMMLASGFGAVLTSTLSTAQLESWGWRIPFLFGLLVAPLGLYIRRHVDEVPNFDPAKAAAAPVREMLSQQKENLLVSIGLLVLSTTATYMILYMPTYAVRQLGMAPSHGFIAALVPSAIITVLTPFIGHWSDRIGRTRIMLGAAIVFFLTIYPAFVFMNAYGSTGALLLAMAWIAILKTVYNGPFPALVSEIFTARTRSTGMAFSYSLGTTIFGGFTPLLMTALIAATGNKLATGFYLMAAALLSMLALLWARLRLKVR